MKKNEVAPLNPEGVTANAHAVSALKAHNFFILTLVEECARKRTPK